MSKKNFSIFRCRGLFSLRCAIYNIQGVPKSMGISTCDSVCSTVYLMLNLKSSFLIHLKIKIHVFALSTKTFLSVMREPRHKLSKYPIYYLKSSFLIHLKIKIHVFVLSTKTFLSDIREPRHKLSKYPISHKSIASRPPPYQYFIG